MVETPDTPAFDDDYFMGLALRAASESARDGETPIGAVVVIGGEVFSGAGNAREGTHDPTAHAEVLAIRHASERLGSWRIPDAVLYVTAEPCLLCTGAIYLARIRRVVFGCVNPKGGALRFAAENERRLGLNHSVEIASGVREMECAQLLRDFFRARREEVCRSNRNE